MEDLSGEKNSDSADGSDSPPAKVTVPAKAKENQNVAHEAKQFEAFSAEVNTSDVDVLKEAEPNNLEESTKNKTKEKEDAATVRNSLNTRSLSKTYTGSIRSWAKTDLPKKEPPKTETRLFQTVLSKNPPKRPSGSCLAKAAKTVKKSVAFQSR